MNGFEAELEIERLLLQVCIVMEIVNLYFCVVVWKNMARKSTKLLTSEVG